MARTRTLLWVFLLGLGVASAAWSTGQGRIHGVVTDEAGAPVAGVSIVVTHPTIASFRFEAVTDEKGQYHLVLNDATRTYQYALEKEGFQSLQVELKIPMHSNTEHDFTIVSLEAAQAQARADSGAVGIFNEGVAAANAGDHAGAIEKLEAALAEDPDLVPAYVALAGLRLQEEDHLGAAAAAEEALAREPNNVQALKARYEAYRHAGDKAKEAEAGAALAAVDSSTGSDLLYTQAGDKYNAGDTAGAQALLEQLLAADDDHAKAHYLMGLVLAGSDPAAAKTHFERFLALAPDDPDAGLAQEMIGYL